MLNLDQMVTDQYIGPYASNCPSDHHLNNLYQGTQLSYVTSILQCDTEVYSVSTELITRTVRSHLHLVWLTNETKVITLGSQIQSRRNRLVVRPTYNSLLYLKTISEWRPPSDMRPTMSVPNATSTNKEPQREDTLKSKTTFWCDHGWS